MIFGAVFGAKYEMDVIADVGGGHLYRPSGTQSPFIPVPGTPVPGYRLYRPGRD